MSQALSPSVARCYGLARVARAWKISRASVYRSFKQTPPNPSARRPGPVGACSDAELADTSAGTSPPPAFTARATASYGRDCALRAFAQAPAGCDG